MKVFCVSGSVSDGSNVRCALLLLLLLLRYDRNLDRDMTSQPEAEVGLQEQHAKRTQTIHLTTTATRTHVLNSANQVRHDNVLPLTSLLSQPNCR